MKPFTLEQLRRWKVQGRAVSNRSMITTEEWDALLAYAVLGFIVDDSLSKVVKYEFTSIRPEDWL